jgi:phosphatidate cytidylyltransferase
MADEDRPSWEDDVDAERRRTTPKDPTESIRIIGPSDDPPLRLDDDTGPLPHWTEPPTGEVPRVLLDEGAGDDLDAWSGFGGQAPVWRDDVPPGRDDPTGFGDLGQGVSNVRPLSSSDDPFFDEPAPSRSGPVPTIRIGGNQPPLGGAEPLEADPTGPRDTRIGTARERARRAGDGGGSGGTGGLRREPLPARGAGRNMPVAVGVGLAIAALYVVLAAAGPGYLMILVTAALALAGVEYFDATRRAGFQAAQLVGVVAVAACPLAAWYRGTDGLLLVAALAAVTTLVWLMGSGGLDADPVPSAAVTVLGVVYVGVLGSYAALILQLPNGVGTLTTAAVGTVLYDVGGLLIGSSAGRSRLLEWISPNKTREGLAGGCLAALAGVIVLHLAGVRPWDGDLSDAIALGIVVAVAAPLGDLAESMLKRSLGVKDMGTLLPEHGGALDRFDALLFVLPATYYLALALAVY